MSPNPNAALNIIYLLVYSGWLLLAVNGEAFFQALDRLRPPRSQQREWRLSPQQKRLLLAARIFGVLVVAGTFWHFATGLPVVRLGH